MSLLSPISSHAFIGVWTQPFFTCNWLGYLEARWRIVNSGNCFCVVCVLYSKDGIKILYSMLWLLFLWLSSTPNAHVDDLLALHNCVRNISELLCLLCILLFVLKSQWNHVNGIMCGYFLKIFVNLKNSTILRFSLSNEYFYCLLSFIVALFWYNFRANLANLQIYIGIIYELLIFQKKNYIHTFIYYF